MKALLEIYLRTAGVALARQHFLTTHEYMNAKFVISKPLCDRCTFSKEYFHSKSTGLKCTKPAYYGVLGSLPLCRDSVSSLLVYRHQKRYHIAGDILFESSLWLLHPRQRKRSAFFQTFRRHIKRNIANRARTKLRVLVLTSQSD